jgi:hypothetical protein
MRTSSRGGLQDDKQAKRCEWRQEPDKDAAAGGELDQPHPPSMETQRCNAEPLELINE